MNSTPQLLLSHHLKALRLPTFLREYDKVSKQCAAEGVDHSRYLLRTCRAGSNRPGTPHGGAADQAGPIFHNQKPRQL